MDSFQIFFSIFFFFMFFLPSTSAQICEASYCDGMINSLISVEFPFQLINTPRPKRCGYPGFNLSCNNGNQTILTLPYSGDFVVEDINYMDQSIEIRDPDECFPRRFLRQNFTLSGSPYQLYPNNYTFYNCSNMTSYGIPRVSCLSDDNFTVLATVFSDEWLRLHCQVILNAPISVKLSWSQPSCEDCEWRGKECALKSDTSLEVGCFEWRAKAFDAPTTPSTRTGLPRSARDGILIGTGILGLLCLIGLTCYRCNRAGVDTHRHQPNTQLSTSIVPQHAAFIMGLDGPIIESYPNTLLGESQRLPNPNDNTCSICLSEYQPKETLRTIPECNHYFHANCIDEWLKLNATCPICRNSPNQFPSL